MEEFSEFRESEKSLQHKLGSVSRSSLLPVYSWHCSIISIYDTRGCGFETPSTLFTKIDTYLTNSVDSTEFIWGKLDWSLKIKYTPVVDPGFLWQRKGNGGWGAGYLLVRNCNIPGSASINLRNLFNFLYLPVVWVEYHLSYTAVCLSKKVTSNEDWTRHLLCSTLIPSLRN